MLAGTRAAQRSFPAEVLPPLACDVGYATAPESPTHLVDNGGRPLRGLTTSTPSVPMLGPCWSYPSQNQSASQWGVYTPRPGSGQLGYVGSLFPKGLRALGRQPSCEPQDTTSYATHNHSPPLKHTHNKLTETFMRRLAF